MSRPSRGRRTLPALVLLAAVTVAGIAVSEESPREFELRDRASGSSLRSAGGEFALEQVVPLVPVARGGAFEWTAAAVGAARASASCFCSVLFEDGFESGDTAAWSPGLP